MRDRYERRLAELGAHLRAAVATATGTELIADDPADPGYLRHDAAVARGVLDVLDLLARDEITGVWTTLDRAGCNRLIRNVRKARDSAYGRDE